MAGRTIEPPRITRDDAGLAIIAIVETHSLRIDTLPEVYKKPATRCRKLLKKAVSYVNRFNILPTVELIIPTDEGDTQAIQEKLIFVTTVELPPYAGFVKDFYVNSAAELLSCIRSGDITLSRKPASNKDYVTYTRDALKAIEQTIEDGMREYPPLRLVKS